jgi:hypothetical protein
MKPLSPTLIKTTRWTARVLSIIAIIFHALSFLGDRWSGPLPTGDVVRLGLWGLVLLGMMLAWKWERLGGLVIMGAFVVQVSLNPGIVVMWAMWIGPITGSLFLASSLQERNRA